MRKGFTLIEMLGVIIILGILAVAVTPIVNNLIDNGEKTSALVNAKEYIKIVHDYNYLYEFNNGKAPTNGTYIIDKNGNLSLSDLVLKPDTKGQTIKSGLAKIEDGVVTKACFELNNYYVNYNGSKYLIVDSCPNSLN